jgi:hypothetical protein
MQQVTYANGKLWGALDTALNPDGGVQRAGIAWYVVNPGPGSIVTQGYLGAAGYDFTYPAIGVTASGRGVMAFTATGDTVDPSAAYAPIDANVGVGAWNVVPGGTGAAQDDGFTSYKSFVGNPPRTRWATTEPRPWTGARSGSPASTSPRLATTPTGAAPSSRAALATTCWVPAPVARQTIPARRASERPSETGRRGSAS